MPGDRKTSESYIMGALQWGSNHLLAAKDNIRNAGKEKVSGEEKADYVAGIKNLLDKLEIEEKLKTDMMKNVENTIVTQDFIRATSVLTCLANHGLRGNAASEFLKGAHFIVEDNGELIHALASLNGA